MAIGYNGPRAQTMLLNVSPGIQTGGKDTKQPVYIHTECAQLQPMLRTPFILDLIKNSNRTEANNSIANSRYYYAAKQGDATQITGPDNQLIKDPVTLEEEEAEILVAQLAPESFAKKFKGSLRDLQTRGLENSAAMIVSGFLEQRRQVKQMTAWKLAIDAAQKVQNTSLSDATTFKEGAHYVNATYNTPKEAYDDLVAAINSFRSFGLPGAKHKYNQDLPMCMGINDEDMVIITTSEFAGKLFETPGLYASDKGNELFQKADLKYVLGVPFLVTNTLPAGTNFMIITTGTHGTIGYEQCGNIAQKKIGGQMMSVLEGTANMVPNPNWSGFFRIDCEDIFKLGIIFADLCIVSSENVSAYGRKGGKAIKSDIATGVLTPAEVEKLISMAKQDVKSYDEQINHLREVNEAEIKKGDAADKKLLKSNKKQAESLKAHKEESLERIETYEAALEKLNSKKDK